MTTSTPLPCRAILALALALVSLLPRPGSAAAADSAGVWSPIAAAGAPSARSGQVAVWTGKELLIWGGVALDTSTVLGDGARTIPVAIPGGQSAELGRPDRGTGRAPSGRALAC